jgi:hypothetical protein
MSDFPLTRLKVYDGKYEFIFGTENGQWVQRALRHGQPWRDCTGDGFILALGQELAAYRDPSCLGLCRHCQTALTSATVAKRDGRVTHDAAGALWCQACVDQRDATDWDDPANGGHG